MLERTRVPERLNQSENLRDTDTDTERERATSVEAMKGWTLFKGQNGVLQWKKKWCRDKWDPGRDVIQNYYFLGI